MSRIKEQFGHNHSILLLTSNHRTDCSQPFQNTNDTHSLYQHIHTQRFYFILIMDRVQCECTLPLCSKLAFLWTFQRKTIVDSVFTFLARFQPLIARALASTVSTYSEANDGWTMNPPHAHITHPFGLHVLQCTSNADELGCCEHGFPWHKQPSVFVHLSEFMW